MRFAFIYDSILAGSRGFLTNLNAATASDPSIGNSDSLFASKCLYEFGRHKATWLSFSGQFVAEIRGLESVLWSKSKAKWQLITTRSCLRLDSDRPMRPVVTHNLTLPHKPVTSPPLPPLLEAAFFRDFHSFRSTTQPLDGVCVRNKAQKGRRAFRGSTLDTIKPQNHEV